MSTIDEQIIEQIKELEENKKRDRTRKESNTSDTKSDGDINSPDHKKCRNEKSENMETFDLPNEDLAIVYATKAITKLSSETKDLCIFGLIDCYNPILKGETEMIKKHMLEESIKWKNREEKFKSAIKFVLNNEEEINSNNVEHLAEMLLCAIGNKMPKYCNDCTNWYVVGRENKPKMFCCWCKVGMHDCLDVNTNESRHGLKWFCCECDEHFSKQIQPLIRNIEFKGFSEKETQRNKLDVITKKLENIRKEKDGEEVIDISEDEDKNKSNEKDNVDQGEERKQENVGINNEDDVEKGKQENNNSNSDETNKKEEKNKCWYWLNKKCKYEERCKYEHPVQCKVMLESGKCPDSRCKLAHPKICRGIFYNGYCSRRNCWYIHPTKIRNRYQNVVTNNENINQRNPISNNEHFLLNWPRPAEASMNIHQTLARLIGTMEKVDTRMDNLEKRQMNRWAY